MKTFAINLGIAVLWLFLSGRHSALDFLVGFVIGFAVLAVFGKFLNRAEYPRRGLAVARFACVFALEFMKANLIVARTVLFLPKEALHPDFIHYDVTGMEPGEILLLSYCITLTPGTTTVSISDDRRTLVIHALDADDPAATRRQIDERLRKPILRFTR